MKQLLNSFVIFLGVIITASCAGLVGAPSSVSAADTESIAISPSAPSVRVGQSQSFSAVVSGVSSPQLQWSVNNIVGGNSTVGTITTTGSQTASYAAPASISAQSVTITAALTSKTTVSATSTINLLNPVPQLITVSPQQLAVGSFSLTLSGASFVKGAVVNFGTTSLQTTFVSTSQLTAAGSVSASQTGSVGITVSNPNPGSATSNAQSVQLATTPAQAPRISIAPASASLLTGAMVHAAVTASGNPAPTVSCSLNGGGLAQFSGSTLTYTAPSIEPANSQAVITCNAMNSAGSSSATFTADVATVISGYAGPIPASYFGMHVMQPYEWPLIPIGSLGKVPGGLWPYLEPAKGQYNWAQLDTFLNLAEANGITLMYATDGIPPWAAADQSTCVSQPYFGPICSGYVYNIQDWDDFVTALVTRYKGRIQIYELWNEPAHTFTGTMAEMVTLTQHEHDIIRSIDPSATILSPSMVSQGYTYLDTYWSSGGPTDVDAVAIHTYPDPRNDVAESITMSISTTIKSVMAKHGLSAKPIWGTEGSWGPASAGDITDVNLRTAFIAREFLLSWSTGLSRFYWYAWDSSNVGTLWTSGTVLTPPALAYEQVRSWMVGATMQGPCTMNPGGTAYHAIYTCTLTRVGYQAIAVWNTDGNSTYTVPSEYLHYRNLQGTVTAVPADHQVTIGLEPILLYNQ